MEIINEQEYKEQLRRSRNDQRSRIASVGGRAKRGGGRGRASGGPGHGGQ